MFTNVKDIYRFITFQVIIILIFSVFYYLIGKKDNTHFTIKNEKGINKYKISYFDALYLSIVTQSTVGYGDITPNSKITKIISMIQMVLIYLFIGGEILF